MAIAAARAIRPVPDVSGPTRPRDLLPLTTSQETVDESMRALLTAMEEDRRRIARDLHDVVGQALTSVKLSLEGIRRDPTRSTDLELRRSVAIIEQAMRDVRDVAIDLRPSILDDLGLVAAARWYLSRQARVVGYRASFAGELPPGALDDEVASACFRALQEALTNVARHAEASRVRVEIRSRHGVVTLSVHDDGVGFDVRRPRGRGRRPSLGLIGMAERVAVVGGTLEVTSAPGEGTAVRITVPRTLAAMGDRGR